MVYWLPTQNSAAMQDRWYSDNRDVVKWATLLHLAQVHRVECIVQVVFLQPGPAHRGFRLRSGKRHFTIAPEVWEHFPRDVARIRDLAVLTGITIRVLNEPFHDTRRDEYTEHIVRQIRAAGDGRKIVFLDPDNGLAPRHANGKHVAAAEARQFWIALQPADWLVLYQHRRRSARWREETRAEFARACGAPAKAVRSFECREIAHDVVFFALRKPPAGIGRYRRPQPALRRADLTAHLLSPNAVLGEIAPDDEGRPQRGG
jgi:hypothetical protein